MLGNAPERTSADLNFNVAGIPVRVHPMFWVIAILFGMGGLTTPPTVVIWVAAVFLAILVHELGHAFAQRYFGYNPSITLYAFGGLAAYGTRVRRPRGIPQWLENITISLAGPTAGFALAGLVLLAIFLAGRISEVALVLGFIPFFRPDHGANPLLVQFVNDVFYVCVLWGALNLLPIYPLDGGQVARELLMRLSRYGVEISLILSILVCAALVLLALTVRAIFAAVLFGMLGYQNLQALQFLRSRRR